MASDQFDTITDAIGIPLVILTLVVLVWIDTRLIDRRAIGARLLVATGILIACSAAVIAARFVQLA